MDPFSICVGCSSLAEIVFKVSSEILTLIKTYRGAREELLQLKLQLDELTAILELLKRDEESYGSLNQPASEKTQEQINICMDIMNDIENVLREHQGSWGRAVWTACGKSHVMRLSKKLAAAVEHFKLCVGIYNW